MPLRSRRNKGPNRNKVRHRVQAAAFAVAAALQSVQSLCDVTPHEGDTVLRAVANRLLMADGLMRECGELVEGKK